MDNFVNLQETQSAENTGNTVTNDVPSSMNSTTQVHIVYTMTVK